MKSLCSAVLLLAFSALPSFGHHMAVVVSKQNAVSSLPSAQLGKIFRAEVKKWPNGMYITLVLHRDSAGEAVTLTRLNKMSAQQWQAWVTDHKDVVKILDSDAEVLSYVANTPGAVGLVDVRSVTDQVSIVRVDGKVPMEDGYLPH